MINPQSEVYDDAATVTPSDTVNQGWTFDAIAVGGAGNVAVVFASGEAVTLTGLLAGTVYRVRGTRINSTNTTATSLVALRYR